MKIYLLQGFLLGLAYVAPIGTQNIYVINTALKEKFSRAISIALLTVFFDITLALACFWGIGILVDKFVIIKGTVLLLGCIIVTFIGIKLIVSIPSELTHQPHDSSLLSAATACFVITWFNPQALIDGSLLLGGIYATLPQEMYLYFIIGLCSASFLWFTSLTGIFLLFRGNFSLRLISNINKISGVVISLYGIKLGYSFVQLVHSLLK